MEESEREVKEEIGCDQTGSLAVPLPYPNVKCFNNLAEYESFMKGGRGRAKPENVEKKLRRGRRGGTDPERIQRLKLLMHRLRVKVHIRSFKGLRGVCTGFMVAFDKFWNLAMVDVDETYREPLLGDAFYHEKALTVTRLFQKLQVQAASGKKTAEEGEASEADVQSVKLHPINTSSLSRVQAHRPATKCIKKLSVTGRDTSQGHDPGSKGNPKTSRPRVEYGRVRTRHVNQLFIRGENVLLVNIQHD
ncbi:U7 snRNA-associated Sm-like protein LSm11 [Bagarius yarrelli]|uniref:U7 snRNA-associated Sm-like protein LSm11 n=1 Tax=Bagarius yarrelli TaxID=175774 RepID=A0A556V0J8_BAGYA|nr:U7 snRNA-associated Sm-like protein LSm11 [Bagarius yarrelli]